MERLARKIGRELCSVKGGLQADEPTCVFIHHPFSLTYLMRSREWLTANLETASLRIVRFILHPTCL